MVKSAKGVFIISASAALLFWFMDAVVDYSITSHESFLNVLLFDRREVAFRLLFSGGFLAFGLYLSKAFAKQKRAEDELMRENAERKRAEERLRETTKEAEEEKARILAIMDAISDGISVQDINLKVLYQNRAHKNMSGGEFTGAYCYERYAGIDRVCEGCPVALSLKSGGSHTLIKSLPREGGTFSIEIKSSPLIDSGGKIVAGIEVVRDISERKRMEGELRRHLAAMEASMDGMAIADLDGKYLYLNDAHAAVYGYGGPEELIGKTWRTLYHEDEIERFEREVFPLLREKGSWRGEAAGKRKDGSTYHQELSLTTIEGGGIVCVVRDVSDRKSAEREREDLIVELRDALSKIKMLKGLLPMCAWCKKIRDDKGYWRQVEIYIAEHSDAEFTHGICPDCLRKGEPELYDRISEDPKLRQEFLKNKEGKKS